MIKALIIIGTAFLVAAISGVFLIPFLHKIKFGQEIREEGPAWHKAKSGTPTMGGFIFIFATIIGAAIGVIAYGGGKADINGVLALLAAALGFGAIGFIDDYIKVILKRNLGLRAKQKFTLQFLVAVLFSVWLIGGGVIDTSVKIPFTDKMLYMSYYAYIPFIVLVMLAAVNSVNLTDGIDGLASTVTLVVCLFYLVVSSKGQQAPVIIISSAVLGGLGGFLIYNKFPAKVFMGDTGSLFLGGVVSAMAIYMKNPLALLIVGFVYVAEAMSVILQVAWFKKTGKRIFKMSPIHHHFEMCGCSEKKIVLVFSVITALLCLIGLVA